MPELQQWAATADACHAVRHSLALLRILAVSNKSSPHYPFAIFAAALSIWAYIKHLPAHEREQDHLVALDEIEQYLGPAIGPSRSTRRRILQKGAKLLVETQAWRIGSAFALVLTKEAEHDGE